MDREIELLKEIEAICIGADSPDAIENARLDPLDELSRCQSDLMAISIIVEKIFAIKGVI